MQLRILLCILLCNVRLQSIDELSAPKYIIPVIVFSCQHCDEQKFQTLSCVHLLHYLSSRKLDIFIRALLRSHPCCRKNYGSSRVHLVVLVIALIYGGGTDRLSDGQTKTNIADDNFFFFGGGGEKETQSFEDDFDRCYWNTYDSFY